MKTINYGANFIEDGLQCERCGSINDFEVTGFCNAINGYGKVMRCCNCANRVTQMYLYEDEADNELVKSFQLIRNTVPEHISL